MIPFPFQAAQFGLGGAKDPNATAVYNSLIVWWGMNDNAASATIEDQHTGNNDLRQRVDNTSTKTQTGLLGSAQRVNNNSATKANLHFPTPENTLLDFVGDVSFTVGGWFKSTASTNPNFSQRYFGRASGLSDPGGWAVLRSSSTANIYADIKTSGGAFTTTAITITPTNWNFLVFRYDAATDVLSMRVNSTTNTTGSVAGGVIAGTNPADFTIGRHQPRSTHTMDASGTTADFDVDDFFACNIALSDANLDYLYNSGAGKSYSNIVTD